MVAIKLSALWVAISLGLSSALVKAAPLEDQLAIGTFSDLYERDSAMFYEAPKATGGEAWADGFAKAQALIDQMTIEEKVNVTTGFSGKCVGFTGEVPRLNLTAICLQDGPLGVRPARRVSQFPAGVTVAATWDRDLIAKRAEAMADEFKNKGVNLWLGPVTGGPLGRAPRMGRNWEGWSPDEYLSGEASFLTVKHAQKNGLMTCSKHYIAYEQETFRNQYNNTEPYSVFPANGQSPISSNVDDKTTHELYLWSFAEAVRAGTAAIMCSYNEVNGTHACEDDYSLNYLLKTELNFQAQVVSDWGGTWSNKASALGGLDVTMPGSAYGGKFGTFYGENLVNLVKAGKVPEERLNDMVLRVLGPTFAIQDFENYPKPSFDVRDLTLPTNNVRKDHHKIIKTIGEESVTMLKNTRKNGHGGLPLKKLEEIQSVAVIGDDAGPNPKGWTSCGQFGRCEMDAPNGTLTSGGGSGWGFPPYIVDPLAAIQNYVRDGGPDVNIHLDNWNLTNAETQASVSEVALVFVNAYATEGNDRQNLTLWGNGDELIKTVARNNNNTVVIVHSAGPVLMEEWIDHENVTAVLYAYYPGQEGGNSLPPILWGEKSPSGKLPFTVAKKESDFPPNTISDAPVRNPQADFTEKLLVDYKWFDAKNITPRYEFGYGLSYSNFTYGDELRVESNYERDSTSVQKTAEKFSREVIAEGESVYDIHLTASVEVTNSGDVKASEVVQLYVGFPESSNEPPRLLRGFEKLSLASGETGTAKFNLRRKDISVWNVRSQRWEVPEGDITFFVGSSSRDIRAKVTRNFAQSS
ncbi:putative beta-glucosidase [Violaceomyces palustris]|uniref:Beta-glucosidase n=1 Tax=Violaceomyces palustris TaxID=1673888 RepID=A0ACD0P4I1_9BASI|nr:putative beta-glucosidase [Violaceomyces palustris]